ncbi:MAG: LysR family transcriptional regulator [Deltaproteobacteria bacterium]|nr:LysR family transcriptional regulator [Deltaproteobacteria bacterium]
MNKPKIEVRSKIWVEILRRPVLGPGRHDLLRAVDKQGSIAKAARLLGITYRKAWGQIKFMEEQLGLPLVSKQTGGIGGGGTTLTPEARELLAKYDRLTEGVQEKINERFQEIFYEKR